MANLEANLSWGSNTILLLILVVLIAERKQDKEGEMPGSCHTRKQKRCLLFIYPSKKLH